MADATRTAPILETVLTTINPDGSVNCAAMGVEWGERRIVIKPYRGTRTLRNLRATGAAVVNVTDDILLFSQAALGDPHPPTRRAASVDGAILDDACSWREVRVEAIDDHAAPRPRQRAGGRPRRRTRVPRVSTARATRCSRRRSSRRARAGCRPTTSAPELRRLQVLVDKTAGPREREAMEYVTRHVDAVIGDP